MNPKELFRTVIVSILTLEARAVLKKYRPNILAVTGSVGKTSTKDALYAALKGHTFVRKSEKSHNSDIGVPLTILGVPNGWGSWVQWMRNIVDGALLTMLTTPYPRWLVVELGADRPGDISRSLSWVTPDIVVATKFPPLPVHVEFYDSPEAVVSEEMHPLKQLSEGGVAVINADDPAQSGILLQGGVRRLSYGFTKGADVRGTRYRITKKAGLPTGISFDVVYGGSVVPVALRGVLGKTHAYAILAGMAGAVAAGAPFENLQTAGAAYEAPPGRLRIIEGANGSVIIDDSYNASPVAVEEALATLDSAAHSGRSAAVRRIAVLGDMLELGKYSAEEHTRIGGLIPGKTDLLVSVGVRARGFAHGAREAGFGDASIKIFERGDDAASFLASEAREGGIILIKGSQSMRMERITKALMKNPNEAPAQLPRQDAEWLAR